MSFSLTDFPQKIEAMLSVLETVRTSVEQQLQSHDAKIQIEAANAANKLATSYVGLSRECMRWVDKLKKNASSASLQERIAGVHGFIQNLGLGDRRELYVALSAAEADRHGDAVKLVVGEL